MKATTPGGRESDAVLVERMLSGSTAAFEALYERHFPKVYGFVARRVSQRSEVEDLVQMVFIHALTSLATYRSEATFLRWLYGITRNVLRRHFLKKSRARAGLGRERVDVNASPDVLAHALTPEREAAAREIGHQTLKELEKLDPHARENFLLHHLDGQSIRDLASRADRSEDSLKSDFYRIRRKLASED